MADAAQARGLELASVQGAVANALALLHRHARTEAMAYSVGNPSVGDADGPPDADGGRPGRGCGPHRGWRGAPVDSLGLMGVFDKLLRAGEGKKVRALQALVPDINALEPEIKALSDDALRAKTGRVPPAARQRRGPRRPADRGVRGDPRGRAAGDRPAPLRRAAHGRRGPALRLGRRDEDRRGQDPRVDAARSTSTAHRQGRAPRHGQRLPGQARLRVDGPDPPLARPHRRPGHPRRLRLGRTSAAQYACDITYGTNNEFGFDYLRDNMAHEPRPTGAAGPQLLRSSTRSTRSSSTRPARRSSSPAGSPTPPSSTTSSPASSGASSATSHYDVDEEKRTVAPTDEGVEAVEKALGVENMYDEVSTEPRPPAPGRAQGQGAVQARQGLRRAARRGEDRRRVHRSHPRGPPLVRGPAPGGRGQGGREDQGGEPDPRHDHAPELLPPLRQARRHDRHGRDRGVRVRQHLQPAGRADPDQPPMVRIDQADLIYKTEDAKFDAVVEDLVERYETGQPVLVGTISVEKSEKLSRAAREAGRPPRGAQRQAAHPGGRTSSPRPAGSTPSRWPPTWPVAASTSCSAATPRAWPATT